MGRSVQPKFKFPRKGLRLNVGKYFIKNVTLFFIVLFVPIICFYFLFQSVFVKYISEYNDTVQKSLLQNGVNAVENLFFQVDKLISRVTRVNSTNVARIKQGAYDASYVKAMLAETISEDMLILECMIIVDNAEYAVSSSTTYDFQMLKKRFGDQIIADCNSFEEVNDIFGTQQLSWLEVQNDTSFYNKEPALIYSKPYGYGWGGESATILVFMDSTKLGRIFNSYIADTSHINSLITVGNKPIIGSFEYDKFIDVEVSELLTEKKITALDNENYHINHIHSDTLGVDFFHFTSSSHYQEPLVQTTIYMLLFVLIIFIIGSVLILLIAMHNYKPIYLIQQKFEKHLHVKRGGEGELSFISHNLDRIIEDNINLYKNSNLEILQMKDFFLFQLLNSSITDGNNTKTQLEDLDIKFKGDSFWCISMQFPNSHYTSDAPLRIEEESKSGCDICSLNYLTNGNQIVLIVSFNKSDEDSVEGLISQFCKIISECYHCELGCGNIIQGLENIRESYNQSKLALQFASTQAKTSTVYFNEITYPTNITDVYNDTQFNALYSAILHRDIDETFKLLGEIKQHIIDSNVPKYIMKSMYYQIVNNILVFSKNPKIFEKGHETLILLDGAMDKYSVEEIHENIEELCKVIATQTNDIVFLDNLLEYIHKNCIDVNFSIESLVDHFQIPHRDLSAIFKKEMGMTISTYINDLKISKAVNYLINTNISVKEIVSELGYCDVSSFIRKFKAVKGITPANFRKCYQTMGTPISPS